MKITPIDDRLWRALRHVIGFAESKVSTDADYIYAEGIEDSLQLVNEFTSCFRADGEVSQRGRIPQSWNKETIFEGEEGYQPLPTEQASADQKDANAKKLLEELT